MELEGMAKHAAPYARRNDNCRGQVARVAQSLGRQATLFPTDAEASYGFPALDSYAEQQARVGYSFDEWGVSERVVTSHNPCPFGGDYIDDLAGRSGAALKRRTRFRINSHCAHILHEQHAHFFSTSRLVWLVCNPRAGNCGSRLSARGVY